VAERSRRQEDDLLIGRESILRRGERRENSGKSMAMKGKIFCRGGKPLEGIESYDRETDERNWGRDEEGSFQEKKIYVLRGKNRGKNRASIKKKETIGG